MDRLTSKFPSGVVAVQQGMMPEALERLYGYEETGLSPEQITSMKTIMRGMEGNEYIRLDDDLKSMLKAKREGRLVVLDEPMRPLVWGDKDHDTILCPRCLSDLMGGFQYAPSSEEKMYQCPHCGCPVDPTKAEDMEED